LESTLPVQKELVSAAESGVISIIELASPLLSDPPDDGDPFNAAMDEIESAAEEAQTKITEARKQINLKLQAARSYAPETRKKALAEFSGLQQKLTESQSRLNPYKAFRKDFRARVEAKSQLTDTIDKMNSLELEVEKASMVTSIAEKGTMSDEEVSAAEEMIAPLQKDLLTDLRMLEGKLRGAAGPMKEELILIKDHANGMRKKLDSIHVVLRRQKEGKATEQMLNVAAEKVDKAEETLSKCQEAEMPFLKGLEILPQEESAKAISESEAAASKAEAMISQAKVFLRTKLGEAKRLSPDLVKGTTESLTELLSRAEAASKKLASFKKETTERKMASLLAEVVDGIAVAEKKVEAVVDAAKLFMTDNLDKISAEAIKEAAERTSEVEEEASAACLAAKKLILAKQKEAKGGEATAAIGKLQSRLNAAQQDLAKQLKAAATGEKLIKGKETVQEVEEKIRGAEVEVEKVEELAKPIQCDEGEELPDETLEELGTAFVTAQKVIKASTNCVESHMGTAVPVVKAALQKLIDRTKRASEKLNGVLAATKGQKQKMLSKAYMQEGQRQTEEVEEKILKVNEVELPFLKGIEVLPLQEATETITESEELVMSVQQSISEARTFIASKNLEIKQYDSSISKPVAEEFIKLTERINTAAAKLSQFKRETETRKKTAQMQEAGESITVLETEVKKLMEAVEPFMAESMTESEAAELSQQLTGQAKEVQAKADAARTFLAARQKDAKGMASITEALQKLQERLSSTTSELTKAKKVITDNEQKFESKRMLAEASEMMEKMEAGLSTATSVCAPLLEQGGDEFLVANSVATLTSVLRDYMAKKALTEEAFFTDISRGAADGRVSQDLFVAHLEGLPATTEHEEITFTEPRRVAIFKHMDADKDGFVGLDDFKQAFRRQFICRQGISLTDVFEIAKSKTKGKVEPNAVVEALGNPMKDEATGMTRLECRIVSNGKTGFVTMLGNQGTAYLEAITPFTTFAAEMDKALAESLKSINEISNLIKTKTTELAKAGNKGPLADARTELAKMRPKVTAAQTGLEALKKKVVAAKKDFAKREEAEKNAHIEAREKKAADEMTGEAAAKVEAMEAGVKALEEAVQPMVSLKGAELDAFPTPASVLEEAERLRTVAAESAAAARAGIKELLGKIGKVVKGPMLEAKRELVKMEGKAGVVERKCASTMEAAFNACQAIVDARYAEAAAALRGEVQRRSLTPEDLFAELLQEGEDRIQEAAFIRHLETLDGLSFQPEHARLLCRHIEVGGIGRRKFLALLQQYFVVVRSIAITDEFEISKGKLIRKADADEVIEVLEGPLTDDKVGLTRVKGKSLIDGQEGWITVCGNQGTPFLQEMEKPYYACTEEVVLQSDFDSEDMPVRTLRADEVVELLEGPRKESFSPVVRVHAKAVIDGVAGWLTVKDSKGATFAEPDGQYYSCITSVAMTDELDIKNCNVLRKLTEGEVFTVLEGPVNDKDAGITRVKGKATKDEKEGWITIRGNAGTVYAEASSKHFTVIEDVALHKQFASADADIVRMLDKGEALLATQGPKEETVQPAVRVKGRALSDGAIGWITLKGDNVRPWSPYFNCLKSTPMHDSLIVEGATLVRQTEVGEVVELLEGPTKEDGQEPRIKVRAEKDGAVGWVTVRGSDGTKFFES